MLGLLSTFDRADSHTSTSHKSYGSHNSVSGGSVSAVSSGDNKRPLHVPLPGQSSSHPQSLYHGRTLANNTITSNTIKNGDSVASSDRINLRRLLSRCEAILAAPIKDNVRAMLPKYMEALREQLEYLRTCGVAISDYTRRLAVLTDLAEKEKLVAPTVTVNTSLLTRTTSGGITNSAKPSQAPSSLSLSSGRYQATSDEQLRGAMAARRARLYNDTIIRSELLEVTRHDDDHITCDDDDLIPDDNDITDDDIDDHDGADDDTQPGRDASLTASLSPSPSHDDTQPGATASSTSAATKPSVSLSTNNKSSDSKAERKVPIVTSSTSGTSSSSLSSSSSNGLRHRSTAKPSSSGNDNTNSSGDNDDRAQLLNHGRNSSTKAHVKEDLLEEERRTHDELTTSLENMTGQLKFAVIQMGTRMKQDISIIEQAADVIEKETPRLQNQLKRIDDLVGAATNNWYFLMATLLFVFAAFWFMYIFMKLVPKPYRY